MLFVPGGEEANGTSTPTFAVPRPHAPASRSRVFNEWRQAVYDSHRARGVVAGRHGGSVSGVTGGGLKPQDNFRRTKPLVADPSRGPGW